MADFVTLSCPNCGGKLEITSDVERFACAYCGQEQLVNRGRGIVTLKPVLDQLTSVKQSVERNVEASERVANELALQRIRKEKAEAEVALEATLQPIRKQSSSATSNLGWGIILIVLGVIVFVGNLSNNAGNALVFLIIALPIGGLLYYSSQEQLTKLKKQEELARAPLLELQKQEQEILARLKQTT
jgi:DNA-directed RNA polymerase subunit RPC12/RpoP